LSLPSLRQRADLGQFLIRQAQFLGLDMTANALIILCSYDWPGNYREAQNVLRRLPCQYPSATRVEPWMLPPELQTAGCARNVSDAPALSSDDSVVDFPDDAAPVSDAQISLQHIEQHAIFRALDDSGGNVTRAAQRLGIHRSTLHRKLRFLNRR